MIPEIGFRSRSGVGSVRPVGQNPRPSVGYNVPLRAPEYLTHSPRANGPPATNTRPMHIHILGICGTFMGGVAALAREAGHRVTGCDAGVYPPMSDQLRALGIELIEGFGADQMALKPDVFVVGNVVSRARLADGQPKFPLMEAI